MRVKEKSIEAVAKLVRFPEQRANKTPFGARGGKPGAAKGAKGGAAKRPGKSRRSAAKGKH